MAAVPSQTSQFTPPFIQAKFHSKRLIFRAVEPKDDIKTFRDLHQDPATLAGAVGGPTLPMTFKAAEKLAEWCSNCLLAVMVCLPKVKSSTASESKTSTTETANQTDSAINQDHHNSDDSKKKLSSTSNEVDPEDPTPGEAIGWVCLSGIPPHMAHHRKTNFGLVLAKGHQGKGYGVEVMNWVVEQGFKRLNLHRIEANVWGWNHRALQLYKRVGFKVEGIKKESCWFEGQWNDEYDVAFLQHEWFALEKERQQKQ